MAGWKGQLLIFPAFFGGEDGKGCKPRAVLVDTVVVWRIERVKTLIGG